MTASKKVWAVIGVVIVVVIAGSLAAYFLTQTSTKTTPKTTIVLYTWWATTGKIALKHEIASFEAAYPNYIVEQEVTPGGGGDNSMAAVLSLIKAGNPPDLFQTHMGPMMYSYVSADPKGLSDYVSWTSYYETNLSGKVIQSAFDAGALNGVLLSMPVEVHTMGLLYMNDQVLHHYGLPVPTNAWELYNETQQLVQDGFYNSTCAPWGISENEGGWAQLQLWENNFLALAGPKLYNEFTYGTLNISDPNVMHIINETNYLFENEAKYDLPGWQTMSWTQMASKLISGDIAFLTAGDFVTNYMYDYYNTTSYPAVSPYINNSATPILVSPFPGTQNYFVVNLDSVGVPTCTSPSIQQTAITFVKYWTSPTGNKVWTQWKGISYYLNMPTNYYNTPEQGYMYERLVNTTNPADFVYALSDGGLFISPSLTLESALLNWQEGAYNLAQWQNAIVNTINVEKSSWLSANSLNLGYLGFPGYPFGAYLPPWANSTYNQTGYGSKVVPDFSMYKDTNTKTNSIISNNFSIPSNSEFIIYYASTGNVQINQNLIASTPSSITISKFFN